MLEKYIKEYYKNKQAIEKRGRENQVQGYKSLHKLFQILPENLFLATRIWQLTSFQRRSSRVHHEYESI